MYILNDINRIIESKHKEKESKDELFNVLDTASDEELLSLINEINQNKYQTNLEK